MKAVFINGSPRKDGNTCKMLKKCAEGAQSVQAETVFFDLYDYSYKGCKSCFACKLKGNTTHGLCVISDELKPVLEQVNEADVLVIGTPIYHGNAAGEVYSFLERVLFPAITYDKDPDGNTISQLKKKKKCGLIFTMNAREDVLDKVGYSQRMQSMNDTLSRVLGSCKTIYSCDTLQFKDYSKYCASMFNETEKKMRQETEFPSDLQKAYDLGKDLCK